jgi:hypothetical protein
MDRVRPIFAGFLVVAAVASSGWWEGTAARVARQATPGPATPVAADSPYPVGDALPLLPPGAPGIVDVIAVGPPAEWFAPVVLRNNTGQTLLLADVPGAAHDAAGELLATGSPGAFMSPSILPPGQAAIAVVYFNSLDHLPPDAVLTFEPETEPLAEDSDFRQDLEIVEATREGDAIVGLARNGTDAPLAGKVNVVAVCFDETRAVAGFYAGFANALDLGPAETAPFEIPFADTGPCDAFLVGANGYKKP